MDVEVFLTSSNVADDHVKDRVAIVIDVLRASSTIATALHHGARAIVPAADMAEAGKLASNLDQQSYLLGGERGGEKIEGYHLGNSPLEYTTDVIQGRTIIFNTTNGTRAIARTRASEHLVIGCFLNAARVVDFARAQDLPVTIVCAGWRSRVSLEDTLCAGLILDRLWEGTQPDDASDTAHVAHSQYLQDRDRLQEALRHCNHARRLIAMGHDDDVAYCLQLDALPVLPYYKDSRLVLHEPAQALQD